MAHRTLVLLSVFALAAGGAAIACGGSTEPLPNTTETTNPTTNTDVADVRAMLASASLGDNSANIQLAFFASDATAAATVAIVGVELVDARTGATVDRLTASSPGVWNGRAYEPWNERVTPGGDLRASYTLSAPNWSRLDGDGARIGASSSYSTPYKLRISLRIDGSEVTIESGELQREPQMVT